MRLRMLTYKSKEKLQIYSMEMIEVHDALGYYSG